MYDGSWAKIFGASQCRKMRKVVASPLSHSPTRNFLAGQSTSGLPAISQPHQKFSRWTEAADKHFRYGHPRRAKESGLVH